MASRPKADESRIDLSFIGRGRAAQLFGGRLDAWANRPIEASEWYLEFRERTLRAIGQEYLPVYRMADGEFRFLLRRRIEWRRKGLTHQLASVVVERMGLYPGGIATSWGERYPNRDLRSLRNQLADQIRHLAASGILAPLLCETGNGALMQYNKAFRSWMAAHAVLLHPGNYVPFHFVGELFTDPEFWGRLRGRRVAVCAGFEGREVESVLGGLRELGTGETDFVKISSTRAMLERGVLTRVPAGVSLVFVAAGIGAANVLVQLQPLRVPVLDVGSLLNTFVDRSYLAHGLFPFPQRQALVGLEPQAPIDAAEAQA